MLTPKKIRVLDAARAIHASGGVARLTMRRLATDLGVTAPSLYNFVRSKREILEDIAATERARLMNISLGRIDVPPPVALHRALSAAIEFALTEPHAFRIACELPPPRYDVVPFLQLLMRAVPHIGHVPYPYDTALSLLALLEGITLLRRAAWIRTDGEAREVWKRCASRLLGPQAAV